MKAAGTHLKTLQTSQTSLPFAQHLASYSGLPQLTVQGIIGAGADDSPDCNPTPIHSKHSQSPLTPISTNRRMGVRPSVWSQELAKMDVRLACISTHAQGITLAVSFRSCGFREPVAVVKGPGTLPGGVSHLDIEPSATIVDTTSVHGRMHVGWSEPPTLY